MVPIHVYVTDCMSHSHQSLMTAFSALGKDGTMPPEVFP